MSKARLSISAEDFNRIIENVNRLGETSEQVINDYIHSQASETIIRGITQKIPKSKRGKVHAKTSVWYEKKDYNLAVNIANSVRGKRGTSFYYLTFVNEGTGTSKLGKNKNFMARGLNAVYDEVVNGIVEELQKNITKEL